MQKEPSQNNEKNAQKAIECYKKEAKQNKLKKLYSLQELID